MTGNGYFVTGTGTGIGKTVASTVLAIGFNAYYWKPIQTGSAEGTDSDFAAHWIGQPRVLAESYIFPEPLSPHLAAKIHGAEIDLEKCLDAARGLPKQTIIEGAGGVLVPINSDFLMIDLIQALERPVVVVAGTELGTINHTLLTLEALKARQIPVAGFLTVGNEKPEVQKSIEQYGKERFLGHIPHCSTFSLSWFQETFTRLAIGKTLSWGDLWI